MENKFKRTTVTSALPYANGPVHIGHLAGVYVPADIYVRYLRLKKEDVLFIGGSDEHGVPITIRAKKEGITPQDVVDRYHTLIKESFKEFGISFDIYSRTTSKTHHELASEFFKTLYDKSEFIEKTSMQYYDDDILSNIIRRSASILDVPCSVRAASEIASRSRGTPRIANALLRRVRDFAQVKGTGSIDTEIAQFALEALNIDKYGLDEIDNKILCTIIDKFKGGPVGITTIATALGEDAGTIEEVYEPFLIKEGFMKRTPRGREVTELAYKHLGRSLYNSQKTLFND